MTEREGEHDENNSSSETDERSLKAEREGFISGFIGWCRLRRIVRYGSEESVHEARIM